MNKFFSKIIRSSLISSVGLAILGVLLIFESEATIVSISYIIGGILVAMGVLGSMKYFYSEPKNYMDMVYGIITVILGIVVIMNPQAIASIIPFIMGILIIISSVTKLQYAHTLNKHQNSLWKTTLILSIITLVFGLVLVFNPFKGAVFFTRLVGGILLVYGILDLISTITISNTFKEIHKALEENIEEANIIEETVAVETEEMEEKEEKKKKQRRKKEKKDE